MKHVEKKSYEAGIAEGKKWEGPNGDGSYGSLSISFLAERAEERGLDVKSYLRGHREGIRSQETPKYPRY